jgi:nucleotide-binding universal stress UspA family protein
MFKRILIPVDGSEPSDAAVLFGANLAAEQGAQLAFAHVCDIARIAALVSGGGMVPIINPSIAVEAERNAGASILQEAVKNAARSSGVNAETFFEEGANVDTILSIAKNWRADLIVIGSHGRGGIARALLGSVAEGVMRRASVPVLVMHVTAQAATSVSKDVVVAKSFAGAQLEVDPVC